MKVETFQPTNLFALADKMLRSFDKFKTAYFKQGNSVNAQDSFGFTLLHYAVARGRVDIVEFLLEQGADPTIENWLHISPLDMSLEDEKAVIAEKLKDAVARIQVALEEGISPCFAQQPKQSQIKLSYGAPAPWRLAI